MEEQGRKLSKEEVEKFYIVLKDFLILGLKISLYTLNNPPSL